jgi:hypothetical protein
MKLLDGIQPNPLVPPALPVTELSRLFTQRRPVEKKGTIEQPAAAMRRNYPHGLLA